MAVHPRQDGFVLLGLLILCSLLLTLGIFATATARTEVQIAYNDMLHHQSLAAAEAGISHAFMLLQGGYTNGFNDELTGGGTGGSLTTLGSLATRDGGSYRFHNFGLAAADGYYVHITDNYDETPDNPAKDTDSHIRLVSRGEVGNGVSIVEVALKADPLFPPYGLFGKDGVTISGGASVDSYDSLAGPYPNGSGNEGNVRSNGDIDLSGAGTTVHGDAIAGGTVDPGSGSITGNTQEGADPLYPPAVPSCGPPYSDGTGISGGSYSPTTGVLKTKGKPADIVLAAGNYCFSSVDLSGGHMLSVVGSVTVNLTGTSDFSGGVIVNPGGPRDLVIMSSYSGKGDGVTLAGGSAARAGVYAPNTGVKLTGNGDFYGGIVGGTITVPGGAQVHYDTKLPDTVPGLGIKLTSWREVRSS